MEVEYQGQVGRDADESDSDSDNWPLTYWISAINVQRATDNDGRREAAVSSTEEQESSSGSTEEE